MNYWMYSNNQNPHLSYSGKKNKYEILNNTETAKFEYIEVNDSLKQSENMLIEGNNINVLKTLIENFKLSEKINLIYIDPPFSTNTIFKTGEDRTSTVSSSLSDDIAYIDELTGSNYFEFLRTILVLLKKLLSKNGSIYVHIDYKIGHYVKILMDEIFGIKNFRNDITRIKCNPKNFKRKGYGNIKDMILFYTKSDEFIWNEPKEKMQYEDIMKLFPKIDKEGRRYTTTPLHAPGETKNGNTGKSWRGIMPPKGRHWRYDPKVLDKLDNDGLIEWSSTGNPRKIIYAEEKMKEGKRLQDIWTFKDKPYPDYPTEKNIDMLKTIISASSNIGDTVLDCFCGSGTTLIAANELERKWIGIDNSHIAIEISKKRIDETNKMPLFKLEYTLLRQI